MIGNILVVDADPAVPNVFCSACRASDVVVHAAASEADVLDYFASRTGDDTLLVCGLGVPECDGVDLIQRLAEGSARPTVVFLTYAHSTVVGGAVALARGVGADDVEGLQLHRRRALPGTRWPSSISATSTPRAASSSAGSNASSACAHSSWASGAAQG